jgi:hypothetical protein
MAFSKPCARVETMTYKMKLYSQTEPVFISNSQPFHVKFITYICITNGPNTKTISTTAALTDQIPKQSAQPQLEEEMECSKHGLLDLGVFA